MGANFGRGVLFHRRAIERGNIYRAALPPLVIALKAWYKRHAKLYPDLQITTINDVTPAMLGTPGAMVIKTKAVETKYFFYFTLEAWSDHQGILDARVYKQYSIAANALKKYLVSLAGNPVTIPKPQGPMRDIHVATINKI